MNAAEITDKLGLHSLRQRAWVCILASCNGTIANIFLVHSIYLRYIRRWSLRGIGMARNDSPQDWPQLSTTSILNLYTTIVFARYYKTNRNVHISTAPPNWSLVHLSNLFLCLQRSTSMRGARVVNVWWFKLLRLLMARNLVSAMIPWGFLFVFFCVRFSGVIHLLRSVSCHLLCAAWYTKSRS